MKEEVPARRELSPRDIRRAAGLPLIAAAVGSHVSETTARVYEADRKAVSPQSRSRLDSFYSKLATQRQGEARS